jgi:hypothetical protein
VYPRPSTWRGTIKNPAAANEDVLRKSLLVFLLFNFMNSLIEVDSMQLAVAGWRL